MEQSKDEYQKLLLTTTEDFFQKMEVSTRLKNSINNSYIVRQKKSVYVMELLEKPAEDYDKLRMFGTKNFKELLCALYAFGIKDIYNYPITKEFSRYRLTKKYIAMCVGEIIMASS